MRYGGFAVMFVDRFSHSSFFKDSLYWINALGSWFHLSFNDLVVPLEAVKMARAGVWHHLPSLAYQMQRLGCER